MKTEYLFLLAIVPLLGSSFIISVSNAQLDINLSGRIYDHATNQSIINASISLWTKVTPSSVQWRHLETHYTSIDGEFDIIIPYDESYRLYLYYDNASTPGVDYVPVYMDLSTSLGDQSLSLGLLPAASVLFEGGLRFIESTKPAESYLFTVSGLEPEASGDYVNVSSYGRESMHPDFLNISTMQLIVPLDLRTQIHVNASITVSDTRVNKAFDILDIDLRDYPQGSLILVELAKYTSQLNHEFLRFQTTTTHQLLQQLDEKGFYTVFEHHDFVEISSLRELAENKMLEEEYDKAIIEMREAYIKNDLLRQKLEGIYLEAQGSVTLLTCFLAITSMILVFFVAQQRKIQLISYLLVFVGIYSLFYLVYPGCQVVSLKDLVISLLVTHIVIAVTLVMTPKLLKGRISSIFSLAKRSLRRQKIRFLLTLITIVVLVMSFVSFTSFSTGYGLTNRKYAYTSPLEGLYIQQPQPSDTTTFHFVPLEESIIPYLESKPEVIQIAQKAENQPQLVPIGQLSTPSMSQSTPIYGIIGIHPQAEAEITHLDTTIIDGRYLNEEENSIIISDDLAAWSEIMVGDDVTLNSGGVVTSLKVVGIFDSQQFQSLKDINGRSVSPSKLVNISVDYPPVKKLCEPREVIIMTYRDAMRYPQVFLSRLDILLKNAQDIPSIARELALGEGLSAFYTDDTIVYETVVGTFMEEKGSFILIPWVIVMLNVIITMLNSMFLYRREIKILSAIGLSPSDLILLYTAQAGLIGSIGGGLGYLLGIGNYKAMSLLSLLIQVRPKISAIWSIAAVGTSVSATLVGVFVAIRYSSVITPSMRRKWHFNTEHPDQDKPWTFQLPFHIQEETLNSVLEYIALQFRGYLFKVGIDENVGTIQRSQSADRTTMHFLYLLGRKSQVGSLPFQVIAQRGDNARYTLKVICKGGENDANKTVSFVRMAIIEWSGSQQRA